MSRTNRRDFLKVAAAAGTGFWVASGHELEGAARQPGPNDRLNVAIIGAGGQGGGNLGQIARTENIVALCDVDDRRAANAYKQHPKAARYHDFRVMLDKQRNIDAVVVSTPDHTHAIASITAMRMGKHCYCEKPLTHDVYEARLMREVARKHRVATQMGNQHTANSGLREAVEGIRAGAIGDVREVHVWTNRPGMYWKQGLSRPNETPPVPEGLNWDLWLGPAPQRPYHGAYVPFAWRGWWDFGTGALGDMACHTMNLAYMALRLGYPSSVSAQLTGKGTDDSPPNGCIVTYEFPARDKMPAVTLRWYEVERPPQKLLQGERMVDSGSLLIGSRGTLYSPSDYGGNYTLLPRGDFKNYKRPERTLPRAGEGPNGQSAHHAEWLRACRGGPAAMSNFVDYAGQFTEVVLLGNVAIRTGQRIVYDPDQGRAVDNAAADRYIRREYRKGWTL
ncbi:MAG: Gfo/Idh/MocA family oxidoreductase [Gemmataceae bacterium]|nr:Gfo/Idh/MocA family oxidoreductase [Gemmataceae bacterium]